MKRTDVRFRSGGQFCAAWRYEPEAAVGPLPIIVMAHGLGGTKEMRLDAYAERFAAAGYACLVFDYRHFGASEGRPRQLLSVRRQLADWRAAVSYARGLAGVDSDRIVLWGTSFGGGHALAMAVREPAIAAVIVQCPFTDGVASSLAVDPLTSVRVAGLAIRDGLAAALRRPPVYLPTAAQRGSPALMSASDALPGVLALVPAGEHFENDVTARAAIDIFRYAPGRRAKKITSPLFAALCEHDSVAPAKTAHRQISKASRAEVRTYPIHHFDIYLGAAFDRVVADQLAFLAAHVPLEKVRS